MTLPTSDAAAASVLPVNAGPAAGPASPGAARLDALPIDAERLVSAVVAPAAAPHWGRWLQELGFLPGEAVKVIARGMPGREPLVVRIGQSTFALRRAEAACVQVVER